MLEVVHGQKYETPPQRRPDGRAANGGTKKGNKKRSLRGHSNSVEANLECDGDDDDEKDE